MTAQELPPLKFRVLIVDDEELPRNSSELVVEVLGLEPIMAGGNTVEELRENAMSLARNRRCHLAIVDTQLRKGDRTDQSGILLIPKLKPAYSIVHSGTDDGRDRTDAGAMNRARHLGAVDYVKKGDDFSDGLSIVVDRVLKDHWNWELEYDLQKTRYTSKTILAQLFPPGSDILSDDIPEDEVDFLLRQTFVKGTRFLELENLEGILHTTTMSSLRRSVVLSCEARTEEVMGRRREILKLAPAGDIVRETKNFGQYVEPHLQHQYTALIRDAKVSWDIGLIRYTDETIGRRRRFTEWYADRQVNQIGKAISHLYKIVLKPWYDLDRGEANKSRGNIFEYYTDSERFKRFSHHISGFTRRENTITIESLVGLINPVTWAERNKDQSRFHTYWNTLVHGDLHSGNIIVDDEAHTYIIDRSCLAQRRG